MALFPSYLPHRVHPVKSGIRFSVVAWFVGDAGPESVFWRQAANSYANMLRRRPEICESHEWFAETLASTGRWMEAADGLVNALDCTTGNRAPIKWNFANHHNR